MPRRYTITAALPYTNGPIHIGHLAGVYIPADIYARYLRMKGSEVLFVSGSDEHGVPITIRAKKEGITPQQLVDKYHEIIKKSLEDFGISFDIYSRTTSKIHHKTASDFFKKLYDNNEFVEDTQEQLYDEKANQFLADRFVIGQCPHCQYEEAYGDQCENCGRSLSVTDLINPKSAITGNAPTLKATKHWYLPLNKYETFLKDWIIEGHKDDWKSNVYGQVKSWIEDGLRPRAVTRDLDWGIAIPVENAQGKVLYVWFDAPIGYISASKEWAEKNNKDWTPFWKDKETELVHFIGKDNIVFHCIIFPAMLKAHGDYILPTNVPANEFLNLEGKKISTSKNWAVWLHSYLEQFPDQQDVMRYALTAMAPETKDNDFTWKDFQARNNNELVAILGNFINRVVVLTHKYFDGKVPSDFNYNETDREVLNRCNDIPLKISESIEKFRFREGLTEMMNMARLGNKYLAEEEPWKVIKEDVSRVQTILKVALELGAKLAYWAQPFLPYTARKLSRILNIDISMEISRNTSNNSAYTDSHLLGKPHLLFAKIEDSQIENQMNILRSNKENTSNPKNMEAEWKPDISFDDFQKMDVRIGSIKSAQKIEKSKKLLKIEIDLGTERRTIVSGIAPFYTCDELLDKQVVVLVNLSPRKMMGITSQGMILMGSDAQGNPILISPLGENAVNGGVVS